MARPPLLQWPTAVCLAAALAGGGCVGLSIPLGEVAADAPAITGSTGTASQVPSTLPASLAYSDASAMAQAARRALAAGASPALADWANPATGSRGSLVALGAGEGEGCRTYASTVTSIKGVHLYTSRACRTADGQVAIRSIQAGTAETPARAGI